MAPTTPFSLATCHLSHPIAPSRPLQDVAKLTKEVKAIADMTSNPPMAMAGSMVGSTQPVAAGMSQLERDIQTMVSHGGVRMLHGGVRMLGCSIATRPFTHSSTCCQYSLHTRGWQRITLPFLVRAGT